MILRGVGAVCRQWPSKHTRVTPWTCCFSKLLTESSHYRQREHVRPHLRLLSALTSSSTIKMLYRQQQAENGVVSAASLKVPRLDRGDRGAARAV